MTIALGGGGLFTRPGAISLDNQRIHVPVEGGFKVYSLVPHVQLTANITVGMAVVAVVVMRLEGRECLVVAGRNDIQIWQEVGKNVAANGGGGWRQVRKSTRIPFNLTDLLGDPVSGNLYALCQYRSVPQKSNETTKAEEGKPMSKIYRLSIGNPGKVTLLAKVSGWAKVALAGDALVYAAKRAIFTGSSAATGGMVEGGEDSAAAAPPVRIVRSHPIRALAVCPADPTTIAVGDSRGRIFVIRNAFGEAPQERVLHWHTGQVASLDFSPDGSYLISGGQERVLVSWHLGSGERQFLPRLSAPISHVGVGPEGASYQVACLGGTERSCAHSSNSLYLVSPANMTVKAQINGIAPINPEEPLMVAAASTTAGDAPALWLSSAATPGHLQLYDLFNDCPLGDFDCSRQNIVAGQNRQVIPWAVRRIIEIPRSMLVTLEERPDPSLPEAIIRVWKRSGPTEQPQLLATASVPFDDVAARVTDLTVKCDQHSSDGILSIFASTNLGSLLMWTMTTIASSHSGPTVLPLMAHTVIGSMPVRSIDMVVANEEGILVTTCGSTISLWNGNRLSLIKRFSSGKANLIEARMLDQDHLVARDNEHVAVWNLSRGDLVWSVILKTRHMMVSKEGGGGGGSFTVITAATPPMLLRFGIASPAPNLLLPITETDILAAALLTDGSHVCLLTRSHRLLTISLDQKVAAAAPPPRKKNNISQFPSLLSKRLLEEEPVTTTAAKASSAKRPTSHRLPTVKTEDLVLSTIPSHLLPPMRLIFWSPFMESKLQQVQ